MKNQLIRKLLEALFVVIYFWGFLNLLDWMLNAFVHSIGLMNILTIPGLFLCVLLSAWLSEKTVKLIREYL